VLCPTRELADQVAKEIRRLARTTQNIKLLSLCGGSPIGPQYASLKHGAQIVVGTPGRIQKHLRQGSLVLDQLKVLVLDEADRMLDMGFYDDMAEIISTTPDSRQTLLFSATYPDSIKKMSQAFQKNPVIVKVESTHSHKHIQQIFYEFDKGERSRTLIALLTHYQPESVLVFCNTRQQCNELADDLRDKGYYARALHGDLEQKDRDRVLVQFANKSTSILIATDVAARGLDIKDLDAVINYDLPRDPEIYIHRIGRTGRAGQQGLALSIFMASEAFRVNAIEEYQSAPVMIQETSTLKEKNITSLKPAMVTLSVNGGRKDKVRAGDILGALTKDTELPGHKIGKIDIFDTVTYIAVERPVAKQALNILSSGKIKGRKFKARKI
ncbi:MAG: ATP-dependent RNA helicase DbpA, partial [Gammaproteobacteria bacterium]|nr:ATP-dependent RNA helicase DbpA [Gammaproteobacteria bacterium]